MNPRSLTSELFESSRLAVCTVEQGPAGGSWRLSVPTKPMVRPAIVLVRSGCFRRRTLGHLSMVDITQCYVQWGGEEEVLEVCETTGYRCTVIAVSEAAVPPLLRARSRFSPTQCRTSPTTDLQHRMLLSACRRGADEGTITAMGDSLVTRLFDELLAAARTPLPRMRTDAGHRITDVAREALATAPAPDLIALAARACVTPRYLARVFRQSTGLPLHQYRNRVRIRLALERLADEVGDLGRVADDLGFADHAHFSRRVMSELGLQPRAVRRLLVVPPRQVLTPTRTSRSRSRTGG